MKEMINLPNQTISCESEQTIKHSTKKKSEYEIRDGKQDKFNY